MLAETAIAMASKHYLLLEGGQAYVEFILRNASITDAEGMCLNLFLEKVFFCLVLCCCLASKVSALISEKIHLGFCVLLLFASLTPKACVPSIN